MKKNMVFSIINLVSFIFTIFFELLFFLAFILSLILNGTLKLEMFFLITFISLFIYQFVFMKILNVLVSNYGKKKISIKYGLIEYEGKKYDTSNNRIIYSRINYDNIINGSAGELIMIVNHNKIKLGRYTKKEITIMQRYLPNIFITR